tara:strand:+ start:439 stop:654 length:216 start_codon:yes stop_codon:yes gene_type:complete
MNDIKLNRLLKPADVAEILGVTKETLNVWRCTKRYPLKYIKIGRNVLYKLEDIQAYIESQTVQNGGTEYAR